MTIEALALKKLFLFDLDGVFFKGKESRVLIGGSKAISHLRERGKLIRVLTNNSTDTTETVHSRLQAFGIPIELSEVFTSAYLTAEYLREKFGRVTYFLVGEEGLRDELEKFGHWESKDARFVVVGLDRTLTYEKLNAAARLLRGGAKLVATHSSSLYMAKDGPALASGPIVKALEFGSGAKALVIGKPSPLMFRICIKRAGCTRRETVMVGDQLDTDILGAKRAGIDSVLVKSGVDRSPGPFKVLATIRDVDELVRLT